MKIIGLTGGIGCGKSTVSTYLAQKGFSIIDADKIARVMTEIDSPVLQELAVCFGADIIKEDGNLDRKALAAVAFSSEVQKENLDNIMMDGIIKTIHEQIEFYKEKGTAVVFLDAPLLFEGNLDRLCAETWVVDTDDEVRIQRVIARDNMSREEVLARINNQMSRNEKRDRADFVLDNSLTTEHLHKQIDALIHVLSSDQICANITNN